MCGGLIFGKMGKSVPSKFRILKTNIHPWNTRVPCGASICFISVTISIFHGIFLSSKETALFYTFCFLHFLHVFVYILYTFFIFLYTFNTFYSFYTLFLSLCHIDALSYCHIVILSLCHFFFGQFFFLTLFCSFSIPH